MKIFLFWKFHHSKFLFLEIPSHSIFFFRQSHDLLPLLESHNKVFLFWIFPSLRISFFGGSHHSDFPFLEVPIIQIFLFRRFPSSRFSFLGNIFSNLSWICLYISHQNSPFWNSPCFLIWYFLFGNHPASNGHPSICFPQSLILPASHQWSVPTAVAPWSTGPDLWVPPHQPHQSPGSGTVAAGPGQWAGRWLWQATIVNVVWVNGTFAIVKLNRLTYKCTAAYWHNIYKFWAAAAVRPPAGTHRPPSDLRHQVEAFGQPEFLCISTTRACLWWNAQQRNHCIERALCCSRPSS